MKISIIITTKNEEDHIKRLLESIVNQAEKNIEIIVVDNKSTDLTVTISHQFTNKVYTKGPERSAQRNFGASKATGDIFIFLDADMILTTNVLNDVKTLFQDKQLYAAVIPEKSIGEGYWSECKIYERQCYVGVDWIESARCFRKDIFHEIGGYDERMSGPEDFDLPQRIKERYGKEHVGRIKSFIIHNEGYIILRELLQKKFYYGRSMKQYLSKKANGIHTLQQSNPINRYLLFLKNPTFILRKPHIFLGVLYMKTTEMIALFLGTIVSKAYEKK